MTSGGLHEAVTSSGRARPARCRTGHVGPRGCNTRFGASLDRPADPIVMTGAALPKLHGHQPAHVVGFSWDGNAWHQIPVQVDDRDLVNPGVIYHLPRALPHAVRHDHPVQDARLHAAAQRPRPATRRSPPTPRPTPTPPSTRNDEVSLPRQRHGQAGRRPGAASPAGVTPPSREEVKATDPLAPAHVGYVYLFHSDTLTGGSAGTTGRRTTRSPHARATTSPPTRWGPARRPEQHLGLQPRALHRDDAELHRRPRRPLAQQRAHHRPRAARPASTILDRSHVLRHRRMRPLRGHLRRHRHRVRVRSCNIGGPVRAIRSYIGANSYKWTVNTDIFYPDREDSVTELRGHAGLPGFAGPTTWPPTSPA